MNRITFCGGESTGSVADRKIETARQESTGGVAVKGVTAKNESTGGVAARIYHQDPELKLETLNKDTVSFRAKEENKGSKVAGTAAAICFTAAGAIIGLGYAKKLNWVDKISNPKVKDFVNKYGAEPCYNMCSKVKQTATDLYKKTADFFKGKEK